MPTSRAVLLLTAACLAASTVVAAAQPARPAGRALKAEKSAAPAAAASIRTRPMTLEEARLTVQMLDDAYQTILTEVHDAYPKRPGRPVAASIVRELQNTMRKKGWPDSHFLAVNALVMNPDHIARQPFDKQAVEALRHSEAPVESVAHGELRAATSVSLNGDCFSCHWADGGRPGRAAISWRIPLFPGNQASRETSKGASPRP